MRTSNYRKKVEIDKKTLRMIIGGLIALVFASVIIFFVYFHVDTVEVMGSSYYSEDEIKEMVLRGPMAKNSVLAPMLYTKHDTDDIPFVEAIDVSQVNYHTICISVREIQPVGCIKYLDCFMYFDRSGAIIESSVERDMRVPFFEGMEISNVAFGDQVPFADESLLNTSVSLSRIFAKSSDIPEHISFDEAGNITLIYGSITAMLGPDKYLEDKMTRLIAILPKVAGQTGILHLENVTDDKKMITFERALTPEEQAALDAESAGTDEENQNDSSWNSGSEESDSGYSSSDSGESLENDGYDNSWDSGENDSSYGE